MDETIERLCQLLARLEPQMEVVQLSEIVRRHIRRPQTARQIEDHLAAQPEACSDGSPAPPTGCSGSSVTSSMPGPAPSSCHVAVIVADRCSTGTRSTARGCAAGATRRRQRSRVRNAAEFAPVTAGTPTGPVCAWCRANDPQLWERCGGCGHVRHVTRHVDGVLPLCARCYERPKRECQGCGRSMLISSEKTGVPLCARCDRGSFRECGRCGRVRRITNRAGPNNPDICDGCYRRPLERCAACGQIRPRIGRTADGARLCARARPARHEPAHCAATTAHRPRTGRPDRCPRAATSTARAHADPAARSPAHTSRGTAPGASCMSESTRCSDRATISTPRSHCYATHYSHRRGHAP